MEPDWILGVWRVWREEYLTTLHAQSKWTSTKKDIEVDDLVILCDDATHRGEWLTARVVAVKSDGTHVRSADVITADGRSFTRDRRKLVNLEIERSKSEPSP